LKETRSPYLTDEFVCLSATSSWKEDVPPLHATQTKKQDARNGSKENLRLLFTVQDAVKAACVEGGAWGCWIAGNHARGRWNRLGAPQKIMRNSVSLWSLNSVCLSLEKYTEMDTMVKKV
jgi:hypothetical protein